MKNNNQEMPDDQKKDDAELTNEGEKKVPHTVQVEDVDEK